MSTDEPDAWQLLGSAEQYRGYARIRRDTYRYPDGTEGEWDVLEQGDTVAVVAFTDDGGVVLFDQFRVGPGAVLGELPGGFIDEGETPVEAGLRELREETGFGASVAVHAGSEWASANATRRTHLVIAAGAHRVGDPQWEVGEYGRAREIPVADLVPHLLRGDLSDAGAAMRGLFDFARASVDDPPLLALRALVRDLLGIAGPEHLRPIAVGLVTRGGQVLLERYPADERHGEFLRAPGGGIDFHETARAALSREFREELDVEVDDARLLGVTENIFEVGGRRGHEIVHVFAVESAQLASLPADARLPVLDSHTSVGWYDTATLRAGDVPVYPDGILDLLASDPVC